MLYLTFILPHPGRSAIALAAYESISRVMCVFVILADNFLLLFFFASASADIVP